jgi:hypothetical protein
MKDRDRDKLKVDLKRLGEWVENVRKINPGRVQLKFDATR